MKNAFLRTNWLKRYWLVGQEYNKMSAKAFTISASFYLLRNLNFLTARLLRDEISQNLSF